MMMMMMLVMSVMLMLVPCRVHVYYRVRVCVVCAWQESFQRNNNAVVRESAHPYTDGVILGDTVHVPDASSLLITFDPRCHTLDQRTSLVRA